MRRRKADENSAQVAENCRNDHSELNQHNQGTRSILRIIALIFLILTAYFGYFFYTGKYFRYNFEFNPEYLNTSPDIILLYEKYDHNVDGKLDLKEFKPLAERILNYKNEKEEMYDQFDLREEVIELNTFFEPMDVEKLRSDKYGMLVILVIRNSDTESLNFLKAWKSPNEQSKVFATRNFAPFLPHDVETMTLGKVWELIPRIKGFAGSHQLPSMRYIPPDPDSNEITLFRILRMFHKRPFLFSRFPPQGTAVTLRARNDDLVDIVFRTHAEFQLNEPPYYPFWFTPAQFKGRIIGNKNLTHIYYFNIYLPNDKLLNIDMEWNNGPEAENMEVDIGYVPKMEITSTGPSVKVNNAFIQEDNNKLINSFKWKEEISLENAFDNLERSFYPFKEACISNLNTRPEDLIRCKKAREAYSFPVTSMIILTNGTVIHQINANDLLESGSKELEKHRFLETFSEANNEILECPYCHLYKKFLSEGLEKSKI